jgi:hypothetical protein
MSQSASWSGSRAGWKGGLEGDGVSNENLYCCRDFKVSLQCDATRLAANAPDASACTVGYRRYSVRAAADIWEPNLRQR